jgi:hypothetical protein
MDIKHLRQALNLSNEKNEQIEQEISRSYNDELKMKTDRLQVNFIVSIFLSYSSILGFGK